jgi:hypothetical protein
MQDKAFPKLPSSVVGSEIIKQREQEIRNILQDLLTPVGLKANKEIHKIVQNSETNSIPIETILNLYKCKQMKATKLEIFNAISDSELVEINGDANGIKSKIKDPLTDFEPQPSKKIKYDLRAQAAVITKDKDELLKEFEPKVFKFSLSEEDKSLTKGTLMMQLQKQLDAHIIYLMLKDTEGYFVVDPHTFAEGEEMTIEENLDIGNVRVHFEKCSEQGIKEFFEEHERHFDFFLRKSGLKRKGNKGKNGEKDEVGLVFYNPNYTDLGPLKYVFDGILSKTKDDETINEKDTRLLEELLTYHKDYKKFRNVKHFTVGPQFPHQSKKHPRCFYGVKKDGTREAFSFDECIDNLKMLYNDYKM